MPTSRMALRDTVIRQGMRLLQDPRVMRLAQDRRVVNTVMRAMQARGRLQESVDERIEAMAKRLNLATHSDLRELRRTVRMLERKLAESRLAQATDETSPT